MSERVFWSKSMITRDWVEHWRDWLETASFAFGMESLGASGSSRSLIPFAKATVWLTGFERCVDSHISLQPISGNFQRDDHNRNYKSVTLLACSSSFGVRSKLPFGQPYKAIRCPFDNQNAVVHEEEPLGIIYPRHRLQSCIVWADQG